jgi:RimJ/RimL family protein N-acetyltransferase
MSDRLQSERIGTYKRNTDPANRFKIPIQNEDGDTLGALVCLDEALAGDADVVQKLTDWRTKSMRFFLTQFTATPERTSRWLRDSVLASDDRILFLIVSDEGRTVGNLGLCNLRSQGGELDNVLRGERGGHPRLMFYAELALLGWMFGSLSLDLATLHVFSNNARAIDLYTSAGFSIRGSQRLTRSIDGDVVRFLADSEEGEPVDFCYREMILSKEEFLRLHPWVRADG